MTALSELNREIEQCQLCEISKSRNKAVPGEGAEDADIMFIGEAPGFHEDQLGRPFVGQAGQFLDRLLESISLTREQVYIAEINNCCHWLDKQIEIIKPRIIVTLGRYSMARYFPGKSISKIHGIAQKKDGVIYFPMYHPAAALHQQSLRQTIEADMKKIPGLMAETTDIREEAPQPQQLNMFEV
jgi:uracil-DNA glycosylase family 4